jgi:hypothetical protein
MVYYFGACHLSDVAAILSTIVMAITAVHRIASIRSKSEY